MYRQNISISMGTDCAPQLANLYLLYYEYSYMRSLLKTNLCLVKCFADTVRYIDDLVATSNSKFNSQMSNIYHPELTLKRTTESDTKLSYCMHQLVYVMASLYLRYMTRVVTLILT